MIHHIEHGQIIDEVLKSDKLVLVDFFAQWCVPCQMLGAILHDIDKENAENMEIFKVNVDEESALVLRYGITAMPTLVFFKNGEEIERRVGYLEKEELQKIIDELK